MRIATASVRTGFAMTHYWKYGINPAGGQRRPPLRKRNKKFGKRAAGDMQEGAFLWIFGQKNTRFKSGINLTILRRR